MGLGDPAMGLQANPEVAGPLEPLVILKMPKVLIHHPHPGEHLPPHGGGPEVGNGGDRLPLRKLQFLKEGLVIGHKASATQEHLQVWILTEAGEIHRQPLGWPEVVRVAEGNQGGCGGGDTHIARSPRAQARSIGKDGRPGGTGNGGRVVVRPIVHHQHLGGARALGQQRGQGGGNRGGSISGRHHNEQIPSRVEVGQGAVRSSSSLT